MRHDELTFTSLVCNYHGVGRVEAVQLTSRNFSEVQRWLNSKRADATLWTNESFVVGLWVDNTWHDRHDRTPVPFGWWVYEDADGRVGVASEVSYEEHYTRG